MVGVYLMLFQQILHTVNFLLHKINSTNFISQIESTVILAISVSKRCTLDLSLVKAQGSIAGSILFSYHSAIPEKYSLTILLLPVFTLG